MFIFTFLHDPEEKYVSNVIGHPRWPCLYIFTYFRKIQEEKQ